MTERTTIHSTAGLWTGLITLLLFNTSVRTELAVNGSSAVTPLIEEGSKIVGLRKIEAKIDSALALERANGSLEAIGPEAVENIVSNDTVAAKGSVTQGDSVITNEKLKVPEAALNANKVEDKRVNGEFLTEFDRDNNGESQELDEENDAREPTTQPTRRPADKNDNDFSLINDTNVNYAKKKIGKDGREEDNANKSVKDNSTNVIVSGDDGKTKGPKSQVEIIKNSTLPKILRLSEDTNETRKRDSVEDASGINNQPINGTRTSQDDKKNEDRTEQIPRGRTISFGGTNEFISDTNKTNPSGDSRRIVGSTDDPVIKIEKSDDKKSADFKPYPYTRITKKDDVDDDANSEISSSTDSSGPESTEEASALDNTIGQRQEDEKVIVTEASVVIDNSIQQFKPMHPKRSGNTSRTLPNLGSTLPTTISSLEVSEVTSATLSTSSLTLNNRTTILDTNFRVSNTDNDVPLGAEVTTSLESKGTSGSLDLTGNGITEVTQSGGKNDSGRVIADTIEITSTTEAATTRATDSDSSVQNTTEKMITTVDNVAITSVDLQTEAEDSMFKVSPLNVTEGTTRIPVTQAHEVITVQPETTSMTTGATSPSITRAQDQTTTISPQRQADGISEETPRLEETSDNPMDSTTTNVEYEFVGLTENVATSKEETGTESSSVSMNNKEEYSSSVTVSNWNSSSPSSMSIQTSSALASIEIETTTGNFENFEISTYPVMTTGDIGTSDDFTTIISTLDSQESVESGSSSEESNESTTTEDFSSTETNDTTDLTTISVTEETTMSRTKEILPDLANATESGRSVDSSSTTTSIPEISTISSTNSTASMETTESTIVTDTSELTIVSKSPVEVFTSSSTSTESTTFNEPESSTEIFSTIPTTIDEVNGNATNPGNRAVPQDELTSLVRIIFEGDWTDVCPHLPALRQSLADLLSSGLDITVLPSQIIFQKNPCTESYTLSSGTTEMPLTTILLYVVDKDGNYDADMTKLLPSLYSRSPLKLQVTIHSFQLVQEADSGNAIAVVVVSCVALICLVLLAGLLFIMRKRQTRFNYGERCRPVSLDAYSLDSVSAYNSVRGRKGAVRASKRSYGNPTFEDSTATPSHPLNFAGLSAFCNEQNTIAEEFTGIPQVTARIDELPQGAEVKNRYANVVPLPETRVSLMKINNDPLSEYINASYVRGPKNATKYYIACQAPIESTVTDFWRMIWEQQSKVVIMLTDLVENGVEKCAEYIPPSEVTDCHRLYGDYQVTLKKRETKEKYAISTLHLKNLENNTFREISHIWYLWPANGVQTDAAGLIAVLLEARALQRGGPGPVVVHCSPGTGRTGTLIALDLGIRQYEITRTVDVPRVVYTIRRDRAGAVQTKEQYAFIYKALNLYATKLAGGALES